MTESSGRVQCPTASATSEYSVMVEKQGFSPMAMSWAAGRLPASFEFPLSEAQSISGRVVDQDGHPVVGAEVEVTIPQSLAGPVVPRNSLVTKSDTEGKWRCDVVPKVAGYITVEASHPEYAATENDVSLEALHAGNAVLKLSRVATVKGLVLDPAGQGVGGADVVLGPPDAIWPGNSTLETKSDQAGEFEFRRVRLEKRLLGIKSDAGAPILKLVDVAIDLPRIEVKLPLGFALHVRVIDQNGQPIRGVAARIDEWPSEMSPNTPVLPGKWSFPGWEWRSDADGRFTWAKSPPQPAAWSFSKAGYMSQGRLQLTPKPKEQVVTLAPAFALSGSVIDSRTARPVPAFTLAARFAQISAFGGNATTNFGLWEEYNRQSFTGGQFNVSYEHPLLLGASQMHAWQFRAEADGYAPLESRVIRDEERGTNLDFQLEPARLPEIAVPIPSGTNRVTAGIALQPTTAAPGDTVTVLVKVRIAAGHWIYAPENPVSTYVPTTMEQSWPSVLRPTGPWGSPQSKLKPDGTRIYAGEAVFQRRFTVERGAADAVLKLPLTINYQVCNEALCWPPAKISLASELKILRSR